MQSALVDVVEDKEGNRKERVPKMASRCPKTRWLAGLRRQLREDGKARAHVAGAATARQGFAAVVAIIAAIA
jgi:hypothetical protein